MLKNNTRVVKELGGQLGSVLGSAKGRTVVKWDDGCCSIHDTDSLIPFHKLKAMFKYGPKLNKRQA